MGVAAGMTAGAGAGVGLIIGAGVPVSAKLGAIPAKTNKAAAMAARWACFKTVSFYMSGQS
jgi:hypothetical protein